MKKFKVTRSLLDECVQKYRKCKNNQIQLFDLIKTQYNTLEWFNIFGNNSPVSMSKYKTRKKRSIQSTHVSNYKERISINESEREINNSKSGRDKNSNNSSQINLNADKNISVGQQIQFSKREHSNTYTDSSSFNKYNQILTLKRYSSRDLCDNSSYQSLQKYNLQNNQTKGQNEYNVDIIVRSKSRTSVIGIDPNEDVRNKELKIQALLQPTASESEDEKANKPLDSQLNHQSFKDYRSNVNSRQNLIGQQQLQNKSNQKQQNQESQIQNNFSSLNQINYQSKQSDGSSNNLYGDGNQEMRDKKNIQLNFKKKIQHDEQLHSDSQSQKNISVQNSSFSKKNSNSPQIMITNRNRVDQLISQGNLSQRDMFQSEIKSLTPKVIGKEKLGLNYLDYLKQPQQIQNQQIQIQQLQQKQQSSQQQQSQQQLFQKQPQSIVQILQLKKKNDNSKSYNVDKFFKDNQMIQEEKRRRSDKDTFVVSCSIRGLDNPNTNLLNNSANNLKRSSQTNTINTTNISLNETKTKVRERELSANLQLNKSASNSNNNQNSQNSNINNISQMTYSNYLQLNSNQIDTIKDIYKQNYNKINLQQQPQNTNLSINNINGNQDMNVQQIRKPENYIPLERLYPSHSLHTPEETPVSRKHAISLFGIDKSGQEQIITNVTQGQPTQIQKSNIQLCLPMQSQYLNQSNLSQNQIPNQDNQSQNQQFQGQLQNPQININQKLQEQISNVHQTQYNNITIQQNLSNKQQNMQQQHFITNTMSNQQANIYNQQVNNYNQYNNSTSQYNILNKQSSNESNQSVNNHNQPQLQTNNYQNQSFINQQQSNISVLQNDNHNKQLSSIYNQKSNAQNSSIVEQNLSNYHHNVQINTQNQTLNINPVQNALSSQPQNPLPIQSSTSQQLNVYTSAYQKDQTCSNIKSIDYNMALMSKSCNQNQQKQDKRITNNNQLNQKFLNQNNQQQISFYQNQMNSSQNKQSNLSNNTSIVNNFNNAISIHDNIPNQNQLSTSIFNVNQIDQNQNQILSQLHIQSTTNQNDQHYIKNQQNILQNSKLDLSNLNAQQIVNQLSSLDTPSNNQINSMNVSQQNNVSSQFHNYNQQIQKPLSSHSLSNITQMNQQYNLQNRIYPQIENQQQIKQLDQQKQIQSLAPSISFTHSNQVHLNLQSQYNQNNQQFNNLNNQQQSNSLQNLMTYNQSESCSPLDIKQEQNKVNLLQQKSALQTGSQVYSNSSNNKFIYMNNNVNDQQNPQSEDNKQIKQKDILNMIQLQMNQNQQQFLNIQSHQNQNTIYDSSQTKKTQKTTINSNRQVGIQLLKPSNNQASFFQIQKKQNQQQNINMNQQPQSQNQQGIINIDQSTSNSSLKSKQLSQNTSNYNSSNNSNNGSNTGSVATKNTFQQQIQVNQQQFVSLVMNQQQQQLQQQQKLIQIPDQSIQHKMQCSSSQKGVQNINEISDQPSTNSHLHKLQQRKNPSKFQSFSLTQNELTSLSQTKLQQQGNNFYN